MADEAAGGSAEVSTGDEEADTDGRGGGAPGGGGFGEAQVDTAPSVAPIVAPILASIVAPQFAGEAAGGSAKVSTGDEEANTDGGRGGVGPGRAVGAEAASVNAATATGLIRLLLACVKYY